MSKTKNILKIILYLFIIFVLGYLVFTCKEIGIWKNKKLKKGENKKPKN